MNNELYHYGVKGMKWGIRKKPSSNGSSVKRDKRVLVSDDKKKYNRRVAANIVADILGGAVGQMAYRDIAMTFTTNSGAIFASRLLGSYIGAKIADSFFDDVK